MKDSSFALWHDVHCSSKVRYARIQSSIHRGTASTDTGKPPKGDGEQSGIARVKGSASALYFERERYFGFRQ